jgi:choline dehydrogenase-like flavoprotein
MRAEIVVIGSGPGGSVTAAALSEAGRDVVLLEEGALFEGDSCRPFSRQEMASKYRHGGITVALGKPKVIYAEGRCVGGGSEINGGLWLRTPDDVLDEWRRRYQVRDLEAESLRPHFQQCEKDLSVSQITQGVPLSSFKLHEGATKFGWRTLAVPLCFASGTAHDSNGNKQSMTRTLIPRALDAGCKLMPDTKAERVRKQGARWIVQSLWQGNGSSEPVTIEADAVFLAGGAIQTPSLLKRSGITLNVGKSLRFHPAIKVVARFAEEVNDESLAIPVHQVNEFAPDMRFGCSISTLAHLSFSLLEYPQLLPELEHEWKRSAIYYGMTRGGLGSITSIPGFEDPLVSYALSDEDLRDLAQALKKLCQLLLAAGAEVLFPSMQGVEPIVDQRSLERLPDRLGRMSSGLMSVHLFSSCPMGENRSLCAVDSFGKVHDQDGLYVADASLLCGPPGVNPQASIMAITLRNALKFLGRL